MFCVNCGNQLDDKAVICTKCGVPTKNFGINVEEPKNETNVLAIVGFALSFVVAIAGLICSIIGLKRCNTEGLGNKGLAIAGIVISSVSIAITVIYFIFIVIFGLALFTSFLGIFALFM